MIRHFVICFSIVFSSSLQRVFTVTVLFVDVSGIVDVGSESADRDVVELVIPVVTSGVTVTMLGAVVPAGPAVVAVVIVVVVFVVVVDIEGAVVGVGSSKRRQWFDLELSSEHFLLERRPVKVSATH